MSYVALYRKWRPKTFTDVVGQKQVSETLMRAIREDKVAHAYLFSGPRGTGKTSMAKIFARAINCEQGPTDTPCNACTACTQILKGDSMDVLEIDAASNRGIDEVRALRESAKFLPVEGRKKIFIIDEAHMLTNEAWNALLKTIEEPPAHIMFIFATTEPEKLPVTILSRCQRYAFRRITAEDIAEHLMYVAAESGIQLDVGAAQLIAIQADGGLRDALSILDQCSGMTADIITTDVVEEMIGLVGKNWIISLLDKIQAGDGAAILTDIKQALVEGRDARQVIEALIVHLRALIVAKVMPDAEEIKIYDGYREAFLAQSQRLSMETINTYVRALQHIQNDAKHVDNPRIVIEMGLLGLCAELQVLDNSLLGRVDALETQGRREGDALRARISALENKQATLVSNPIVQQPIMDAPQQFTRVNVSSVGMTAPQEKPNNSNNEAKSVKIGAVPPGKSPIGQRPPRMAVETHKATSQSTPTMQSTIGNGLEATIGTSIVIPSEYRTILSSVVKWMSSNRRQMCAGFYENASLIYADESRVVIAFNNDFSVKMATGATMLADAKQAFSQILGANMEVEIVTANSDQFNAYAAAAMQTMQSTSSSTDKHSNSTDITKEDSTSNDSVGAIESFDAKPVLPRRDSGSGRVLVLNEDEISKLPKWDKANMSEEEQMNPLLVSTLEALTEEHDIYVEVIED